MRLLIQSIFFLTLILAFFVVNASKASNSIYEINIGGVFPSNRNAGNDELAAFLLALREINFKHDGIADDLLPDVTIKYAVDVSVSRY